MVWSVLQKKKSFFVNLSFLSAAKDDTLPRRVELLKNKAELKEEMSRIVTIFKINCSRRIQALREKHKKELLHLAKLKKQAESLVIKKGTFRRDSLFALTFSGTKTQENSSSSERNGHAKQNSSHKESAESGIETMV